MNTKNREYKVDIEKQRKDIRKVKQTINKYIRNYMFDKPICTLESLTNWGLGVFESLYMLKKAVEDVESISSLNELKTKGYIREVEETSSLSEIKSIITNNTYFNYLNQLIVEYNYACDMELDVIEVFLGDMKENRQYPCVLLDKPKFAIRWIDTNIVEFNNFKDIDGYMLIIYRLFYLALLNIEYTVDMPTVVELVDSIRDRVFEMESDEDE